MLPEYLSAYRKFHSCETAVKKIVNDCLWAVENQSLSAIVLIDLSAAFDMVDHDLLLGVLFNLFGVGGKALEWYDSYLRPRAFKVCVDDKYSSERDLTFNVPQGSLNGPVLYLACTFRL